MGLDSGGRLLVAQKLVDVVPFVEMRSLANISPGMRVSVGAESEYRGPDLLVFVDGIGSRKHVVEGACANACVVGRDASEEKVKQGFRRLGRHSGSTSC